MANAARDEHLRGLLADRMFDVAFVIGTDGVVTWRRESGHEPLDLDEASSDESYVMGRLHPEDLPKALNVLDGLSRHPGERAAITVRVRPADNSPGWVTTELIGIGLTDDPVVGGVLVVSRSTSVGEIEFAEGARGGMSVAAAAPVGLGLVSATGALIWANGTFAQLTGLRPGQSPDDEDDDTRAARAETARLLNLLLDDDDATSTIPVRDRYIRLHARWLGDEDGAGPQAPDDLATRSDDILISAEDVSPAMTALADQAAAEATFRAAFDHSHAGIALVNLDGRFLRLNPAWATITGYDEHQLLGRTFAEITHPDDLAPDEAYVQELLDGVRDSYRMEKRYLHRSGGIVWVDLRVVVVRDPFRAPVHFVSTIIDISERKGIEDTLRADNESLSYRATHDHLTGLPNRHLLEEHLRVALGRAPRSSGTTCLLMADLDRFKAVNDGHGHAAGDAVLVEVANRLRGVCREGDIVARWGGDEFVVVAESDSYPDTATRLAERLIDTIGLPIDVDGASASVGVSIGIARIKGGDTIEGVVARADAAAYGVKQAGGGYAFGDDAAEPGGGA
jgi:diguanylate cyclase (GGDEF)-like protein/PAS domain S-box-containing protein